MPLKFQISSIWHFKTPVGTGICSCFGGAWWCVKWFRFANNQLSRASVLCHQCFNVYAGKCRFTIIIIVQPICVTQISFAFVLSRLIFVLVLQFACRDIYFTSLSFLLNLTIPVHVFLEWRRPIIHVPVLVSVAETHDQTDGQFVPITCSVGGELTIYWTRCRHAASHGTAHARLHPRNRKCAVQWRVVDQPCAVGTTRFRSTVERSAVPLSVPPA